MNNTECRYRVGDTVRWQGQQGECAGEITRITKPENSDYVLWIGDFPIGVNDVSAARKPSRRKRERFKAAIELFAGITVIFCHVMLIVSMWLFMATNELKWAEWLVVYLVIVAFDDLGRQLERRQNIALKSTIRVHNWNFVDEDGKPVVVTRSKSPEQVSVDMVHPRVYHSSHDTDAAD